MRKARHALLSAPMERILVAMRDDPEEELTRSGRAWWLAYDQVNGKDCNRLLQYALINVVSLDNDRKPLRAVIFPFAMTLVRRTQNNFNNPRRGLEQGALVRVGPVP